MLQYKVYLTPTLLRFCHGQYEEGNHVLRMNPELQFHFMRVNFASESQEVGFYSSYTESLLDYNKRVLVEGIKLGNRRLTYLGQSNSQ